MYVGGPCVTGCWLHRWEVELSSSVKSVGGSRLICARVRGSPSQKSWTLCEAFIVEASWSWSSEWSRSRSAPGTLRT